MYVNFSSLKRLPLRCAGVRNACWGKMSNSSTKESHLRQSWRCLWVFEWFSPGNVMALWDKTCLDFFLWIQSDNDCCNSVSKQFSIYKCMPVYMNNLTLPLCHQPFLKVVLVFPPNQDLLNKYKNTAQVQQKTPVRVLHRRARALVANDGKSPKVQLNKTLCFFWGVSHETPDRLFFKDRGPAGLVSLVRHSCWGWHEEGFSLKWRNDWEGAELLFPRFLIVFWCT